MVLGVAHFSYQHQKCVLLLAHQMWLVCQVYEDVYINQQLVKVVCFACLRCIATMSVDFSLEP